MKTYHYIGPVTSFERIICNEWSGYTNAVSSKQAIRNLAQQYKKQNGLNPYRAKIELYERYLSVIQKGEIND